jgi:hypothetical protein
MNARSVTMQPRETLELLSPDKELIARVKASFWRKQRNGLMDWGGDLRPADEILTIEPGEYILRGEDGRQAHIIVNNVRISSAVGGGTFSAATFLGNGDPL